MKKLFLISFIMAGMLAVKTQNTLQFSQAVIVTNSSVSVPSGKVWKVVALYGAETRYNRCVNFSSGSTDEIGVRAASGVSNTSGSTFPSSLSAYFTYSIQGIIVAGTSIVSSIQGFGQYPMTGYLYRDAGTCSSSDQVSQSYYGGSPNFSVVNMSGGVDLPLWLPAGTSLQTYGPNTFASVIEFTVAP